MTFDSLTVSQGPALSEQLITPHPDLPGATVLSLVWRGAPLGIATELFPLFRVQIKVHIGYVDAAGQPLFATTPGSEVERQRATVLNTTALVIYQLSPGGAISEQALVGPDMTVSYFAIQQLAATQSVLDRQNNTLTASDRISYKVGFTRSMGG